MINDGPLKKQGWAVKLVFMGILPGRFLGAGEAGNTKRPNVAFEKIHAASAREKVVEPEAGRTSEKQMSNLSIGVVPRPSRITDEEKRSTSNVQPR